MVLCDGCDRGEHIYCAIPTLGEVPRGAWYCDSCIQLCKNLKVNNRNLTTAISIRRSPKSSSMGQSNKKPEKKVESDSKPINTDEKKTSNKERQNLKQHNFEFTPRNPHIPLPTYRQLTLSFAGKEIAQVDGPADVPRRTEDRSVSKIKSPKKSTSQLPIDATLRNGSEPVPEPHCQPDALSEKLFNEARHRVLELRKSAINSGPLPKVKHLSFGKYLVDTWFMAPYPEEYNQQQTLYLCEFCLKYMNNEEILQTHMIKCPWRHPPGDEIYRKGPISIFEVDGRKNKLYCQNLCLLAKMFLDHKTLYYDVEPFLFYVMTECDSEGCHFAGYFSKEKKSPLNYNVSCIVTLPIFQRKGYGHMLIDFSYLLSRKEGKIGSPEKPLSDFGLLTYRSYWKNAILDRLILHPSMITINDLSRETSITVDDLISTLHWLGFLRYSDEQGYFIQANDQLLEEHARKRKEKPLPQIDASCLRWTPFCVTSFLKYDRSTIEPENPIDIEHD
jgi:hypothetical protein